MNTSNDRESLYEKRDQDVIDYNATDLLIGDELIRIRKPVPGRFINSGYGVCIGAAQTYGPFVDKPFPLLLNSLLDFPVINLGRGGASAFYFSRQNILDFLNNGSFVVIQIMSARGEENSSFRSSNRGIQNVVLKETGQQVKPKSYYKNLLADSNTEQIMKNISESRMNWIKNYQELLNSIQVPKILFWFSQRNPIYQEEYTSLKKLFSKYPQLVNEVMVNSIKPYADDYVECISQKGIPQKLVNYSGGTPRIYKKDGETVKKDSNTYYPSPEMHLEAAQKLQKICEKYISRK